VCFSSSKASDQLISSKSQSKNKSLIEDKIVKPSSSLLFGSTFSSSKRCTAGAQAALAASHNGPYSSSASHKCTLVLARISASKISICTVKFCCFSCSDKGEPASWASQICSHHLNKPSDQTEMTGPFSGSIKLGSRPSAKRRCT